MKHALVLLLALALLAGSVGTHAAPRVNLRIEGKVGTEGDVVELRHRDAVRSGDGIRFELTGDQPAYVYLLALGSSGRVSVLQPFSRVASDALQTPGIPRAVPEDRTFLPFDETPGPEVLFAFATEQPIGDLDGLLSELAAAGDAARAQERLERRFPGVITVELLHLPGLLTLPERARPRSPASAPTSPEAPATGLFRRNGVPEEPGVLQDEGKVIRSLIDGTPLDRPEPASPPPSEPRSELPTDRPGADSERPVPGSGPSADGDEPRPSAFRPEAGGDSVGAYQGTERTSQRFEPASALRPIDPVAEEIGAALVLVVTPRGAGTGVVVGPGHGVLTSWHLVEGESSISVFSRGVDGVADVAAPRIARVIHHNVFTDLALLEVVPDLTAGVFVRVSQSPRNLVAGDQVHVLSHDAQQVWRHDFAMVVQGAREQSWFSRNDVIHRGPVVRLQMKSPPATDGAPILNAERELVGLKVQSGRGPGAVTAVAALAIRAFLGGAAKMPVSTQ